MAVLPGEADYADGRQAENRARYGDAYTAYRTVAAQGGALQGYALARAAVCQAMGGDVAGGLAELERLVAAGAPEPWTALAQYELGILLARDNRLEEAVPNLLPILQNGSQLWWLEMRRWRAADYLIQAPGPSSAAFDFFRDIVGTTLYRARRRDAAARLEKSGAVEDRLDAAAGFLRSRAYRETEKILFGIAIGGSEHAAVADRIALISGRLLIAQGQRSAGEKVFEDLIRAYPESPAAPSAMLAMARAALRAGRPAEAEAMLVRLRAAYADAEEVGDALWEMARHFDG